MGIGEILFFLFWSVFIGVIYFATRNWIYEKHMTTMTGWWIYPLYNLSLTALFLGGYLIFALIHGINIVLHLTIPIVLGAIFLIYSLINGIQLGIEQHKTLNRCLKNEFNEEAYNYAMVHTFGDLHVNKYGFCKCSNCNDISRVDTPSYEKEGDRYYSVKCKHCDNVIEINQDDVIFNKEYEQAD